MKNLGKIALLGLPPALEMALLQQFDGDGELPAQTTGQADVSIDLVIHAGSAGKLPPAVPALPLDTSRSQRLGYILRQARQMIEEPVLYLEPFTIGPYLFHPPEKSLSREGREDIDLTDKEADILVYLARRAQPVSREELLRHVWRYQEGIDTHTLETHIYRLRQKMEASADNPALLVTVEGGYRLNL